MTWNFRWQRGRILHYLVLALSAFCVLHITLIFSGSLQATFQFKKNNVLQRVHEPNETLTHKEICRAWMCRNYNEDQLLHRSLMTVVSAYFNIGNFQKGSFGEFTPETYLHWASAYSRVLNNVLLYTDDYPFARGFLDLRAIEGQRTCICLLDRGNLWAFSLVPRIRSITNQLGYPKFTPNTIVPEYGAAMHAKYELMNTAVSENVFKTKYFAWSDIGVFRSLVERRQRIANENLKVFELRLPPGFKQNRVAYTRVREPDFQLTIDSYYNENMVWVCGCFFVAELNVMKQWTIDYRRFADLLLRIGWSSTDQQLLYAMNNQLFAFSPDRPKVRIQEYVPRDNEHRYNWFYLAFLCRHEGLTFQQDLALIKNRFAAQKKPPKRSFNRELIRETTENDTDSLPVDNLFADGEAEAFYYE